MNIQIGNVNVKEKKSGTNPLSKEVTCSELAHVESDEKRSQNQDGGQQSCVGFSFDFVHA